MRIFVVNSDVVVVVSRRRAVRQSFGWCVNGPNPTVKDDDDDGCCCCRRYRRRSMMRQPLGLAVAAVSLA